MFQCWDADGLAGRMLLVIFFFYLVFCAGLQTDTGRWDMARHENIQLRVLREPSVSAP